MSESTSYTTYVIVQFLKMIIHINLLDAINSRVQVYVRPYHGNI